MSRRSTVSLRLLLIVMAVVSTASQEAQAGMPSIRLSELAKLRIDAISFFLMVLLACAFGVKLLWNSLRSDFSRLPYLSYQRALAAVVLWGMLSVIVLTMISGARELMTPGAWQRQGFTHSLRQRPDQQTVADAAPATAEERRQKLKLLWGELIKFAIRNDGRFPTRRDAEVVASEYWNVPGLPGLNYLYLEGRTAEEEDLLAYEPDCFHDGQFALTTSGEIRLVYPAEIVQARKVDTDDGESL